VLKHGYTALMTASMDGHTATVQALIGAGADSNLEDKGGSTALMWASIWGHTAIVRALIGLGVDVNLQDEVSGCACSNKCLCCVRTKCGHCLCLYKLS
jgi:ankyrin repeat protein